MHLQSQKTSFLYKWKDFNFFQLSILVFFFLLYGYFRIRYRWTHPLQGDEIITAQGLQLSFRSMLFDFIPRTDFHFPWAYVLLYPIGHYVSLKPLIVSLPYAAISAFFYYIFARINWIRLLDLYDQNFAFDPKWINVFSCGLVARHETLIMHALELRPYGTLTLLAVLALWLTSRLLEQKRFTWYFVAGFFALIVFHNFGLMMILVSITYLLTIRFFSSAANTLEELSHSLWSVGSTLLFSIIGTLPFIWWYCQYPTLRGHPFSSRDPHLYIQAGLKGLQQVIALYFGLSHPDVKLFRLFLVLTMLCGIALNLFRGIRKIFLFPLILVLLPTFLLYLWDLHIHYWFIQRQFLWVMPFYSVFVALMAHTVIDWAISHFSKSQNRLN